MHCREFDENLLRKVFELMYENEFLDLPYAPDVGDYLVCEVTLLNRCYFVCVYFLNGYPTANFVPGH